MSGFVLLSSISMHYIYTIIKRRGFVSITSILLLREEALLAKRLLGERVIEEQKKCESLSRIRLRRLKLMFSLPILRKTLFNFFFCSIFIHSSFLSVEHLGNCVDDSALNPQFTIAYELFAEFYKGVKSLFVLIEESIRRVLRN
ncbi:hypothetical protein RchiOBHm_Chr3g0478471 [Rosa chinensis]|uniref:Uncharacterized protein n=1 Tax=Rosa chinensis TaxID=74649 RepID=A0A2P6RD82_ROSCH|nr:hypothetical protein RchiOBHm_Chr3g0478471 [Rosa chinensis]